MPGRASGCFSVCVGAECKRFGGFAWQSVTWKTRVENVLKYRLGRRRGRFRGCKRGVSGREMGVPGVRKCHLRAKNVRFRGEKWVFSGCKPCVFGAKTYVSDGKTNVPKMGKRRSVCARERFSGGDENPVPAHGEAFPTDRCVSETPFHPAALRPRGRGGVAESQMPRKSALTGLNVSMSTPSSRHTHPWGSSGAT